MENESPIILTGPPGCGKSHWIQEYAKSVHKQLFVCACRKDRTLREGRQKLHVWARRTEPAVLWLEGADDLTPEAQAFLRRILETHAKEVLFILECRNAGRLQEPIRSRCMLQRIFAPSWEEMKGYANTVSPWLSEEQIGEIRTYLSPDEYSYRRIQQVIQWIHDMPEEWERIKEHSRQEKQAANSLTTSTKPSLLRSWIRSGYHPEHLLAPLLQENVIWRAYGECIEAGGSQWALLGYALEERLRRPVKQEES